MVGGRTPNFLINLSEINSTSETSILRRFNDEKYHSESKVGREHKEEREEMDGEEVEEEEEEDEEEEEEEKDDEEGKDVERSAEDVSGELELEFSMKLMSSFSFSSD